MNVTKVPIIDEIEIFIKKKSEKRNKQRKEGTGEILGEGGVKGPTPWIHQCSSPLL